MLLTHGQNDQSKFYSSSQQNEFEKYLIETMFFLLLYFTFYCLPFYSANEVEIIGVNPICTSGDN